MKTATFHLTVFLFCAITCVSAWDNEELEIFDLVEEINENFYHILGIQQDASLAEVKRAFRNLSVVLHPDKNDAEDANIQFRNLVSVYEVLKDSSKREKYNEVLKNGLPNWKSALYYYRRVRKMGLAEMSLIVFLIFTIGQYIVAWAAYAEKKYTAETMLGSRLKKLQKKNKTSVDLDTILNTIPIPSIFNTLPFQIPKAIWNIPKGIRNIFQTYREYKQQQEEIRLEEEKEAERIRLLDEAFLKEKESKKEGIRKRKEKFAAKEKTDAELQGFSKLNLKGPRSGLAAANKKESLSGGFWTDEDLVELVRLVKKYPGGTAARWDVIAETMNRSVHEITFMAAKMKENGYRVPGQTDSVAESIVQDAKKTKVKRPDNQIIVPEITNWTQEQQQLLESAIIKYPKTSSGDRWIKIANTIPGKTKEECLARYKHLVEIVKAQKARNEQQQQQQQQESENRESSNRTDVEEVNEVEDDSHDEEIKPTKAEVPKNKGKPKNKRKERKKRMDFSSDEEDEEEYEDDY